jgi:hypothetical protein
MRVGMLDNGDTTSDSYAVARHQSPLLFSPGVPFLAPAGQEVQPSRVQPRVLSPQGDAPAVAGDEDVAAVRNQRLQPRLDSRERDWQAVAWQMQGLRVLLSPVRYGRLVRNLIARSGVRAAKRITSFSLHHATSLSLMSFAFLIPILFCSLNFSHSSTAS